MTCLVGYSPHQDDRSAIELACQLARSEQQPVRSVTVVPSGWGNPLAAGTDREFENWAAEQGRSSAELAAGHLAEHPKIESTARWVTGRSVPQALLTQAAESDASILVLGSGSDAEPGRIRLTSKTERVVHSSTIPVAIAPRGYRTDSPVTRVTVGFRDDDAGWSLLTRIAEMAHQVSARLRVVTFMVAPHRRVVTSSVPNAEAQVLQRWRTQVEQSHAEALGYLNSQGFSGDDLELCLADGADWADAIGAVRWVDGDVLVVGSSATHRLAQVFLGSSASKIVRNSPVPVVAVPGAALEE
jgi:nucleotide-binding universal stress UspA family protein